MSSSYQAANQPDTTSPHPHVSAANMARPTRLPSPPFRASPSLDARQYKVAASSSPQAPSLASLPVNNDAVPAHKNMVAAAQPTAAAKPTFAPSSHLSLPSRSASFLAPASGATANCEGSSSTAEDPAHSAPFQACTSAQTTNLTAGNPTIRQTMSEAQCGARSAATAYGALAACNGKVEPVQRPTAVARDAVRKVPAASGQPIIIPVAQGTRAATTQRALTSTFKPCTSSREPTFPAVDDSLSYDSSSDDETGPASNGADHEGSLSTARAPAPSAQTTMLTAGNPKTMSKSQCGAGSAATACGVPAAFHGKVAPVPRTTAAAHNAVQKVPAASGHPVPIPVARCTRAASKQRALASQPKPHTNSTQPPAIFPAQDDSSFRDPHSSSDDERQTASTGAAAVSQRPGGLRAGSPEAVFVMTANPLYAGHRTSLQINTGALAHTTLAVICWCDWHCFNGCMHMYNDCPETVTLTVLQVWR